MTQTIEQRVAAARRGENPGVIARLPSGWLTLGDTQPLRGYCVLLADPVVASLNALAEENRARFALDMARAGDAVMAVTGAYRINYEILANLDPWLHAHIIPRYLDEPDEKRRAPPMSAYGWAAAMPFDEARDRPLMDAVKTWLEERR